MLCPGYFSEISLRYFFGSVLLLCSTSVTPEEDNRLAYSDMEARKDAFFARP